MSAQGVRGSGALHRPTSLRSRAPAETLAIARRLMRPLGLTRVVDATPLDRLDLPVFVCLRPRGQTLRVHAGKGIEPIDARTGALMEGLEYAVAESASGAGADAVLPLGEMLARLPGGLRLADFAPRLGTPAAPSRPVPAWRCEELGSRRQALLPAELLMLPAPLEAAPLFGWSSNGLASGNTLEEATLHALLEVLERDSIAMDRAWPGDSPCIDAASLPQPFGALAQDWRRRGVQLHLRHLPNALGLPCIEATLHEPGHAQVALARGYGLHPERAVALARAVSEAAQSRVCRLHREQPAQAALYDGRPLQDAMARPGAAARVLAALQDPALRRVPFSEVPEQRCRSIRGTLRGLLGDLAAHGFGPVFRRRLEPAGGIELQGLQVVKVVVPRCESVVGGGTRMGPRLLAQVMRRQDGVRPAVPA